MRKKLRVEEKNIKFGITIHPELAEILEELSKKEKKTKSKIIQEIMNKHFKK